MCASFRSSRACACYNGRIKVTNKQNGLQRTAYKHTNTEKRYQISYYIQPSTQRLKLIKYIEKQTDINTKHLFRHGTNISRRRDGRRVFSAYLKISKLWGRMVTAPPPPFRWIRYRYIIHIANQGCLNEYSNFHSISRYFNMKIRCHISV